MKLIFYTAIIIAAVVFAKSEIDTIDDKQLDAILKDPKYADLAGDLLKGGELSKSDLDLLKESELLNTNDSKDSQTTAEESFDSTRHSSNLRSKKSSKSDIDLLAGLDLLGDKAEFKGLNLLETTSSEKKEEKKEDDKFKSFDFISKQQARFLIEILKQPVFMNMLPAEAQGIVKVIVNFI